MGVENYNNHPSRNSEDKVVNPRDRELLDICKINDFLIANGRSTGDISENYTSHQWNGSSVTDYMISPNDYTNKLAKFQVGPYAP